MTADTASSTPAPCAPPDDQSPAAWWALYKSVAAELEAREDTTARDFRSLSAIERQVFLRPCLNKADALAKLQAARRSFEISTRNDGNDLRALAGVAAWIEAQP